MHVSLSVADFCHRAQTLHPHRLGCVDEPGVPGSLGRLTYGELLERAEERLADARRAHDDATHHAEVACDAMAFDLVAAVRALVELEKRGWR